MKPWKKYRIADGDETEFDRVRHVAHLASAQRIVEDARIRSRLVYDKSVANTSRISVTWLSANTWADGSLYGTTAFEFPWDEIEGGRNIYWVEAIDSYRPPAFRLLFTKHSPSFTFLIPYDPKTDDGPIRLRNGKWYRNRRFNSEFMLDEDITLDRCVEINFVKHHHSLCNLLGGSCPDISQQPLPEFTASRMLAHTLANDIHHIDDLWKPHGVKSVFAPLEMAHTGIWRRLVTFSSGLFAGTVRQPNECRFIALGGLALYSAGRLEEARRLIEMIAEEKHYEDALTEIIRRHFNDPSWSPV